MNNIKTFFQSDQMKQHVLPEVERLIAVILSTIVYGIGVSWFLEASVVPLYTGGIPGLGQLVRDAFFVWFGIDFGPHFLGVFIIVLNIPILLLGWFGVSHRFTIHSIISILLQAFILSWLPVINMGLNERGDAFASAVLGGLLIGIGGGAALRFGTSTGGLDIIAQFVSLRKGKSVGFISMIMNVAIAIAGGLIVGGKLGPSGEIISGGVIAVR